MLKRIRNRADGAQGGFTLIELLIVIVILGILAAIVVFAVGGINDRGTNAACKSDFKTVETAQEAYYASNKAYAASTTALKGATLLRDVPQTYTAGSTPYGVTTDTTGDVTVTSALGTSTDTSKCPS